MWSFIFIILLFSTEKYILPSYMRALFERCIQVCYLIVLFISINQNLTWFEMPTVQLNFYSIFPCKWAQRIPSVVFDGQYKCICSCGKNKIDLYFLCWHCIFLSGSSFLQTKMSNKHISHKNHSGPNFMIYNPTQLSTTVLTKLYFLCTGVKESLWPGVHSFPFQYTLPTKLPTSFHGRYGYVRYYCEASLERPWLPSVKRKAFFSVSANADVNLESKAEVNTTFPVPFWQWRSILKINLMLTFFFQL